MKTKSDPEREDALLEAMLNDESWQTASAVVKAEALRTFHGRQRLRRLKRWAGSMAFLAVVIAGGAHWFGGSVAARRQMMVAHAVIAKAPDKPRFLTDEELVAAFPRGSCFIAEVDGKKELVFFDRNVERAYVARGGAGASGYLPAP